MEFERVLNGLVKYANNVILPTMNDWQKVLTRMLMARVMRSSSDIKHTLASNAFITAFGVIDGKGSVDVDGLVKDIREIFATTPTLEINVPLYGALKFVESDVDVLYKYIIEG